MSEKFVTKEDLADFRVAVRKETTDRAAQWTVGAVITLVLAAAAGWWLYLKPKVIEIVGGVPGNGVMAFNADDCPPGWSPFKFAQGRIIIGVSADYPLRDAQGQKQFVLTQNNIPEHRHDTLLGVADTQDFQHWGLGE